MYYFFVLKAMCQAEINAELRFENLINYGKYGIFFINSTINPDSFRCGSGFPAAIDLAALQHDRGWKAAPTIY